VNREGQTKTFDVPLAEMPAGATEEGPETSPEESAQPEKITVFGGVAVADVTDDVRSALNLPKDVQGAVIAEIDADSPAGKAGLREGDVIQEVNKQPVKNAKDLVAISKKLKANEKFSCASIARAAAVTSRWNPSDDGNTGILPLRQVGVSPVEFV
jgi:serine protease Do